MIHVDRNPKDPLRGGNGSKVERDEVMKEAEAGVEYVKL